MEEFPTPRRECYRSGFRETVTSAIGLMSGRSCALPVSRLQVGRKVVTMKMAGEQTRLPKSNRIGAIQNAGGRLNGTFPEVFDSYSSSQRCLLPLALTDAVPDSASRVACGS